MRSQYDDKKFRADELDAPKLYKRVVKFARDNGEQVEVEAIYEDSKKEGSPYGTVVGFHGSPGSHRDFKYIRQILSENQIRFIGLNYPGFGKTAGYKDQANTNSERNNFSEALLSSLGIQGRIIYMGHSRGCENALETATKRSAHGLVLINPTGFRYHKGVRPIYRAEAINRAYGVLPKFIADPMIVGLYKTLGFKVRTGEECINSLQSDINMSLDKQKDPILISNLQNMKKLIIFGGKDPIIEEAIVEEMLKKHEALISYDFRTHIGENEIDLVNGSFSNYLGVSVYVKRDNHYQTKSRADLIADACRQILGMALDPLPGVRRLPPPGSLFGEPDGDENEE
ncbi:unnamed protein product [Caenorhabditis sp. 36 PRJEB53466]|nr:unnamed protein product [Caenorhabditis sp. 36 PRJEB53466]